jgi:hypothetical protein
MKGRETPKNQALTILKGFSTISEVLFDPITALKFQKGHRGGREDQEGKIGLFHNKKSLREAYRKCLPLSLPP